MAAIYFIAIRGSRRPPSENIPFRVVIDTRGVARDIFAPGEISGGLVTRYELSGGGQSRVNVVLITR